MSKTLSSRKRIGLLGGGQLARMLALKGHELGFEMHVLSESRSDPAAQVVQHHHTGKPTDGLCLDGFLRSVDVATFESEFLDASQLAQASAQTSTSIFPTPHLMGLLQDRLSQKEILESLDLPTLPYVAIKGHEQLESLWRESDFPLVIKKRRFGYDGYGTFHLQSASDLPLVAQQMEGVSEGFIVEPRIAFEKELALSVARNASGRKVALPLVETRQVDSRCDWVKGPARHKDLQVLMKQLFRLLDKLDYVGILAAEIFSTKQGLFINELAPRVHNSAHYSLDALSWDQFSLHLLAITNEALPSIQPLARGFAMANLLGRTGLNPEWRHPFEGRLHWYGKSENRPGRKMGHINAFANSADEALRLALADRKKFQL